MMIGMGHFWGSWGLFAAKTLTLVLLLAGGVAVVIRTAMRARRADDGHLEVRDLGRRQDELSRVLALAMLPRKAARRERRLVRRAAGGAPGADRPRLFVLDFTGDLRASRAAALREEITTLLSVATARDEVLLRLSNPGGTVNDQGFAASQLLRLRAREIPLTVAVDTMAASGGYMMAAVANRIVAAPFAIVGSIGVITVIPNVHRLLERAGVDVEQFTAGRYKRTVTPYTPPTDEGRDKLTEELADTHALFKQWVSAHRPQVDIDRVGTGEHWYGTRALELGLVDELLTSDDYILRSRTERGVYELHYRVRIPRARRFFSNAAAKLTPRPH
jgi:serine protease SohB